MNFYKQEIAKLNNLSVDADFQGDGPIVANLKNEWGKIVSDFIWTEIFGCPEIGIPAIKSFAFHHPDLYVHVFGFDEDLKKLADFPQVIAMPLDRGSISKILYYFSRITRGKSTINSDIIKRGFKHGHRGTAMLWEFIIRNIDSERFIHFDSDVIFLDRCIDDVSEAIKSGDWRVRYEIMLITLTAEMI